MSLFQQLQGLLLQRRGSRIQDQTFCIHTQEVSVLLIKTCVLGTGLFKRTITATRGALKKVIALRSAI